MTPNVLDELKKINSRLGKIERRQDKTEADISELREDRLGQREMLGAIAQGLDRIHERLGPMQDVYRTVPEHLGKLEAKLDSAIRKLDERPCLVSGDCNVGGK